MIKNILYKKVTAKSLSVIFTQNDGIYHKKTHFLPQKMTDKIKKRWSFSAFEYQKRFAIFYCLHYYI